MVSNGFSNNDVGFHFMMAVFFLFTVIIMLNVLIMYLLFSVYCQVCQSPPDLKHYA